ncbi:hypothetical protein ACIBF1_18480 [Spirillospora sp. NPDC050679]
MTDDLTTGRRADRERALSFLREAASSPDTSQAALRGLAHPRQWLALDSAVRSQWQVQGWTSVLRTGTPLALALSACNRDGRIRKRAIRHLATQDDLLPLLAIRATDWMPTVRNTALRLLAEVLADPPPHRFQDLLAMTVAMRDRSRAPELTSLVDAALRRSPDRLLEPALACADRHARRHAVQVATQAGLLSAARLVRIAVEDRDLVVAVHCAEAAEALTKDAAVFMPLLHSPVPTLRALALTRPALAGDAALCAPYLDDRARVVRETAQLGLRRAGLDPAERYRTALRDGATPGRVAGLAETGAREDIPSAQDLLSDPRAAIRSEAVRALHTLGGGDRDTFVAMLQDPSGRVLRQVRRALADHAVPAETLWPLLEAGLPAATRRTAQRLLRDQGGWTRLKADLLLIQDADPTIRTAAAADVRTWSRAQHYLSSTPPELAGLVEDAADVLGEQVVQELRFVLGMRPAKPHARRTTAGPWPS